MTGNRELSTCVLRNSRLRLLKMFLNEGQHA
jgi:hypothetical protein